MAKSMQLPCDLTTDDRLRIGEALTSEITAQEQVEAAKKEATRGFNATIKTKRATIHDLNESLRTGKELREVEVEERPDYAAGIVFVHRLDTGDCVQQRAIDPDERQLKNGLEGPKVLAGGKSDTSDEQREATTPEEAEALRAERLAGERAERISAAVAEARSRITVVKIPDDETRWNTGEGFGATLQFGSRVLECEATTEEGARDGIAVQVTEILEAQEDQAATWADVAAASQAEQDRQEVERLAAEQAADDAATKTLGGGLKNGGLKAPKGHKRKTKHPVTLPDGREVDPEEEAAKLEGAGQSEPPTPGDDGPVATEGGAKPLAF